MPVCPGCGSSYEDQFAFCPYCGRAKPQDPKPIKIEVTHSQAGSSRACPQCHRDDQVVLVSAYIQQNTSSFSGSAPVEVKYQDRDGTTHWHSETVSVHGTQSTKLVGLFRPPREPFEYSSIKQKLLGLVMFGSVAMLIFFALGFVESINVGLNTIWADDPTSFLIFLPAPIFVVSFLLSLSWMKKASLQNKVAFEPIINKWRKGRRNWEDLYYCYRDGIVYIPGRKTHARPEDMWEYCCSD